MTFGRARSRGKARIVGAFEHPRREIPDRSVAQIHAEVALGALADAGLTVRDVDAYFCASDAPGLGPLSLADYLGLQCSYFDSTDVGGSSYVAHVGHAAAAIATGKCRVALITLAGNPRSGGDPRRTPTDPESPDVAFEHPFGPTTVGMYALAARRHMHEFGTTSAQLAEVKVAASHHAQFNPHALLRKKITIDDVLASPMISDPLHRLDCCVTTDGGGALVVAAEEVARDLNGRPVTILGHGEAIKHTAGGRIDLTCTGAVISGPRAFAEAGVSPADIDYASIYDSFTITVLMAIEDLGFCAKGAGGRFVSDGGLIAPGGRLPVNSDGGGLCNNHPVFRGGITKVIEAVRQLRQEAAKQVQVPECELALVHGTGGSLGSRMGSATLILGADQ